MKLKPEVQITLLSHTRTPLQKAPSENVYLLYSQVMATKRSRGNLAEHLRQILSFKHQTAKITFTTTFPDEI